MALTDIVTTAIIGGAITSVVIVGAGLFFAFREEIMRRKSTLIRSMA